MPTAPPPFDASRADTTLFAALLEASRERGAKTLILEDADRKPLTYQQVILGALVLGAKIADMTRKHEAVGVFLPNANGILLTLLGLNAFGRVAALLNFTAGLKNLSAAVATAEIETILTSRRFIETAKLDDVVAGLAQLRTRTGSALRMVYLEDIRASIGTGDKARGLAYSFFAKAVHRRHAMRPEQPAVILFTSGTEGSPKGVVLSNRNLIANVHQIIQHAGGILTTSDIVLNPLPMFHSFGLTAGGLMPLINGIKVVLYPSPLHYKQVPALVRASQATILFATDTFLQGYARAAEEGDLASVRFVIAGAERVKDTTRAMWAKTRTTILEGYGATECSPVIACNLPETNTPGTVGTLLPGIEARLEPVEGISEGGKLLVRGPNVMLGYMRSERPGIIEPPAGGWHDTGDIVTIDDKGLVAIKGRAKRFAKIGGEMISLAAVETMVSSLWPDSNHVVVALPDARKGEQLVLVTDKPDADKAALLARAKEEGYPELWIPRALMVVPQIPVLGSGKIDVPAAMELARQARALL